MYEVNVLGTLHATQALLPKLVASGDGTIVVMSSTAGFVAYEGGGGYVAAKHGGARDRRPRCAWSCAASRSGSSRSRRAWCGPTSSRSTATAATRRRPRPVYPGVAEPLTDEDVADAIAWTVTRPAHVNIDLMVMRPRAQAAQHKVCRDS